MHRSRWAAAHGGQGDGVERLVLGPFPGARRIQGACLPRCSELPSHRLAGAATLRLTTERDGVSLRPSFPAITPDNPTAFSSLRDFRSLLR